MLLSKIYADQAEKTVNKTNHILRILQNEFDLSDEIMRGAQLNPHARKIIINDEDDGIAEVNFFGKEILGTTILLDLENSAPSILQLIGEHAISFKTSALPDDITVLLQHLPYAGIGNYATLYDHVKDNVYRTILVPEYEFNVTAPTAHYLEQQKEIKQPIDHETVGLATNYYDNIFYPSQPVNTIYIVSKEIEKSGWGLFGDDLLLCQLVDTIVHESVHCQIHSLLRNGFDITLSENERYAYIISLYVTQALLDNFEELFPDDTPSSSTGRPFDSLINDASKKLQGEMLYPILLERAAYIIRILRMHNEALGIAQDNIFDINFKGKKENISFSFKNILRKDFLEQVYKELAKKDKQD
ncbi:MAG: hypothetical protein LBJ25_04025 [Candidatus Margulisbacteria bacterium]|nr:hypothetical protein [Candidatus Margulisiibacteriota bacterium]